MRKKKKIVSVILVLVIICSMIIENYQPTYAATNYYTKKLNFMLKDSNGIKKLKCGSDVYKYSKPRKSLKNNVQTRR